MIWGWERLGGRALLTNCRCVRRVVPVPNLETTNGPVLRFPEADAGLFKRGV